VHALAVAPHERTVAIELEHDERARVDLGQRRGDVVGIRLAGQHDALLAVREHDVGADRRGHLEEAG
jgi:hypothetical protein